MNGLVLAVCNNSVKQLLVSEGPKLTINDLRLQFVAELLRKANIVSILSLFDSLYTFGNMSPFAMAVEEFPLILIVQSEISSAAAAEHFPIILPL